MRHCWLWLFLCVDFSFDSLITVPENCISQIAPALFHCIIHMPLNAHHSLFCKPTLWQDIHFMHVLVIKTSSLRNSSLCVHWRKAVFLGFTRNVISHRSPAVNGEINLKKGESRDHVGMKMTHHWKSFYANVHLSLHSHVLMNCQLKGCLKSKGENGCDINHWHIWWLLISWK